MYNKIMIAPSTDLILLQCPIELDQANQLTFASATAQYNYFNGLNKLSLDGFTYQRKDGKVRYPACADDLWSYNYCMYKNSAHGNKWIYAFITDVEYLNDNTSLLTLKTDVWQTWQFALNYKSCFVEREHVNDDTFGLHTIPEGLEYGDYVCNGVQNAVYADTTSATSIVIAFQVTTVNVSTPGTSAAFPVSDSNIYSGIPQGCHVFGIPYSADAVGQLFAITGFYDNAGKGDAIVSIFLIPKACCLWEEKNGEGVLSPNTYLVPKTSMSDRSLLVPTVTRNSSLQGYVPKNNKLFCAPYNYLYLSNNAGQDITYNWEDFNGNPAFEVRGAFEQGGAIKIAPQNSKISAGYPSVTGNGWNEGIQAGKFPTLSWTSDYYLNWIAVNGTNLEIQAGLAAASWGVNTATSMLNAGDKAYAGGGSDKGAANLLSSGVSSTLNLADTIRGIAQQERVAKMTPESAKGNVAAGSLQFAGNENKFTFRKMSIRAEYAKIIDNYLSAFGYKVNAYKLPNCTGRQNWNYVKTIGCNITANIPQTDLQEIKAMFDSGVTLWHNAATFLDYSQSNNIV